MRDDTLRKLIEDYEKLVFSICCQLTRDYHESQNLVQETFLSVYENYDRTLPENEKAWICRIATNKAKDYLKSAYYRRTGLSENMEELEMEKTERSPADFLEEKEGEERIRERICALKEPYRKAAILFFLEENSVAEISYLLDRPPKTVRTQLYRAKNMLRNQLGKESLL